MKNVSFNTECRKFLLQTSRARRGVRVDNFWIGTLVRKRTIFVLQVQAYEKFNCTAHQIPKNYYITNWLLRNPEVHYRPYISSPLGPILSKIYPVSIITTHLPQIHINIILPSRCGLPKGLFPLGLPTNTPYVFLDSWSTCVLHACPSQSSRFKIPNYVKRIIQRMYLSIMQLPLFSCNFVFLSPKYLPKQSYWTPLISAPLSRWETKFHNHTMQLVI